MRVRKVNTPMHQTRIPTEAMAVVIRRPSTGRRSGNADTSASGGPSTAASGTTATTPHSASATPAATPIEAGPDDRRRCLRDDTSGRSRNARMMLRFAIRRLVIHTVAIDSPRPISPAEISTPVGTTNRSVNGSSPRSSNPRVVRATSQAMPVPASAPMHAATTP